MNANAPIRPTPPMLRALEALAASETGKLHYADFYRAMKVTTRGRYLIMSRMEERDWIEREDGGFVITTWGRSALAAIA